MGTINDLALLIPGRGNVLVGAAEAAVPSFASIVAYAANFSTAIPGFATLGHTDPEDLPEWGSDGGDTEVRRTWERLAVREVTTDPPVNYFVVKPLQFDNDTMKLYEGGGTYSTPNVFASPSSPAPTVASAIVVYLDGAAVVAEYVPRVSIRKEGAPEHSVDDWSKLPLRFTQLSPTTALKPHYWIGENFGTPA